MAFYFGLAGIRYQGISKNSYQCGKELNCFIESFHVTEELL